MILPFIDINISFNILQFVKIMKFFLKHLFIVY